MNFVVMEKQGQKTDGKEVRALSWARAPYELCQICCGIVRKEADSCPFCKATKLFFEGKDKAMSASDFKFFRIKLPALAATVFTLLSTWSVWFLLPVPVAGFILCRAVQKYLEGPAWNLSKR